MQKAAARRPGVFHRFLERPRQVEARKWMFQVHLWVGLLVGLYVAVVSVTGSALIFRPEIEPRLVPRLPARDAAVATGPFQAAWNNVRRAYPGHAISTISLNQYPGRPPGDPYRIKLQSGSRTFFVYVDCSTDWIRLQVACSRSTTRETRRCAPGSTSGRA